jgi:hypothetical protein
MQSLSTLQVSGSSGSRLPQVRVQLMKHIHWFFILFTCLFLLLLGFSPVSGASSQIHIVKYAADGSTILNEKTIDYRWMEQNLPVKGDGITHYYLQGPVFVDKPEDRWNPAEDSNVKEKDMGAIKGTDLKDLCNLVGGMSPGDELKIVATDGFSKAFAYENVYEPSSRQGPMVIAWYRADKGYVPAYDDGMRLVFLADTLVNPWGIHAMGAWDWHESAAEKYWYYYYNGNEKYPTTTGVSVQSIGEILIFSQEEPSGTIRVTSEPPGAEIFVDDEDTGQVTPAEITGVSLGSHMVNVQKQACELPESQMVDVVINPVSVVGFTLQKTSSGPASGAGDGSEGSGSIENTGQGATGSLLNLYAHENIHGNISIMPVLGLSGSIKGGEERKFSLPVFTSHENVTLVRLYVFSSGGYDTTQAEGADPSFFVEQGAASIKPDRVYRDRGLNATSGLVTTSCFILPNSSGPGPILSDLIMDNSPGTSCILEGAALVFVSRNDNGPDISYWLHEGADMISAPPGQDNNEAETTTGFNLDPSESELSHAELQFVSTSMVQDRRSRYQAEINGETFSGNFEDQKSPVRTASITIPAPSPGSRMDTSLQAMFNESSALYGETRIEIFTVYKQEKRPVSVQPSSNTSVSPKSNNPNLSQTKTTQTLSNLPVPNTPAPVLVKKPLRSTSKDFSLLGYDTLDYIFAFLFSLVGDPVPLDRNSVHNEPVDLTPSDNTTESGTYRDQTPGVSPESDYSSQEGSSQLLTPVPVRGNNTDTLLVAIKQDSIVVNNTAKPLQRKPVTHSGGIYITSYPADAELRVNTRKIEVVLPAVIYGLKEGIHNVEVRHISEIDKTTVSRSLRVWVYADAVTTANFDLIAGNIPRKILVNSLNNSYSFTVNGYYPIRKSPVEIEFTGPDDFFTVIRDGAYLSYRPFAMVSEDNSIVIPPSNPPLYNLTVESSPPGGEIFVDGIWSGFTTPAVIPNLSSGLHRIIVSMPGHIPGEMITEIPISDSSLISKPVSFVLDTYACGPLTIESIPPGADILMDGFVTGEITPHTFEHLSLGIHQLTVRRNGETRTIEVNIKPENRRREVVMFQEKGSKA